MVANVVAGQDMAHKQSNYNKSQKFTTSGPDII